MFCQCINIRQVAWEVLKTEAYKCILRDADGKNISSKNVSLYQQIKNQLQKNERLKKFGSVIKSIGTEKC